MRRTVLVSRAPASGLRLATRWQADGDDVTAVLLDAAVATLRPEHTDHEMVRAAQRSGVSVLAHDEALRRRSIVTDVGSVDLDGVADAVTDDAAQVIWT